MYRLLYTAVALFVILASDMIQNFGDVMVFV